MNENSSSAFRGEISDTSLPFGVGLEPQLFNWSGIALVSIKKKNRLLDKFPNATDRAHYIAHETFKHQTRRDKTPAISHMERIVSRVVRFKDPELDQIAWLHDLVEEKKYTLKDLEDLGFSPRVIAAVNALTKREMEGEGYLNYIERLAQNTDAITVKLFDINDNTSAGAKPDRLEFLYPIAKEYLIDAKRRHKQNESLIGISEFMCHNSRVQRIHTANPEQFITRAGKYFKGSIPCLGIG